MTTLSLQKLCKSDYALLSPSMTWTLVLKVPACSRFSGVSGRKGEEVNCESDTGIHSRPLHITVLYIKTWARPDLGSNFPAVRTCSTVLFCRHSRLPAGQSRAAARLNPCRAAASGLQPLTFELQQQEKPDGPPVHVERGAAL